MKLQRIPQVSSALLLGLCIFAPNAMYAGIQTDFAQYKPTGGVSIRQTGDTLRATWPIGRGEYGALTLDLQSNTPLIESLAIAGDPKKPGETPMARRLRGA